MARHKCGAPRRPTEGAKLLDAFLDKHDISRVAAAEALGVSNPTVCEWAAGTKRPKAHHREAIAIWTRGEVPAESWAGADERKAVSGVTPFEPQPPPSSTESAADESGSHATADAKPTGTDDDSS